jgi:hypothetical protein
LVVGHLLPKKNHEDDHLLMKIAFVALVLKIKESLSFQALRRAASATHLHGMISGWRPLVKALGGGCENVQGHEKDLQRVQDQRTRPGVAQSIGKREPILPYSITPGPPDQQPH